MKIVCPDTRIIWWRWRLAEYRFNIRHIKGARHCKAYAISRLSTTDHATVEKEEGILVNAISEISDDVPLFLISEADELPKGVVAIE